MGQLTFRKLDGNIPLPAPTYPLEKWYEQVRDVKLADFEVFDLARSCRQELYIDYIVPLALQKLEENPLAGELYDGELVVALKGLPGSYWAAHSTEKARFLELAERAYLENGDDRLFVTEEDLSK